MILYSVSAMTRGRPSGRFFIILRVPVKPRTYYCIRLLKRIAMIEFFMTLYGFSILQHWHWLSKMLDA